MFICTCINFKTQIGTCGSSRVLLLLIKIQKALQETGIYYFFYFAKNRQSKNKTKISSALNTAMCVFLRSWLQFVAQRVDSSVQQSERRLPQFLQKPPQLLLRKHLRASKEEQRVKTKKQKPGISTNLSFTFQYS